MLETPCVLIFCFINQLNESSLLKIKTSTQETQKFHQHVNNAALANGVQPLGTSFSVL